MTTRIGKNGQLSKDRRHELGQRIEDGEPGTDIVQWLNLQPDVQAILQEQFAGRPIGEQNLSDWKQTGHVEWLRRRAAVIKVARASSPASSRGVPPRESPESVKFIRLNPTKSHQIRLKRSSSLICGARLCEPQHFRLKKTHEQL
jgi:hypothetical protein